MYATFFFPVPIQIFLQVAGLHTDNSANESLQSGCGLAKPAGGEETSLSLPDSPNSLSLFHPVSLFPSPHSYFPLSPLSASLFLSIRSLNPGQISIYFRRAQCSEILLGHTALLLVLGLPEALRTTPPSPSRCCALRTQW